MNDEQCPLINVQLIHVRNFEIIRDCAPTSRKKKKQNAKLTTSRSKCGRYPRVGLSTVAAINTGVYTFGYSGFVSK